MKTVSNTRFTPINHALIRNSRKALLTGLLGIFLLTACSPQQSIKVPPLSTIPSHRHEPGKIVWHDLITSDMTSAKRFYGSLFDWQFRELSPNYTLILLHGKAIGGIAKTNNQSAVGQSSRWLTSLSVSDVDAAANLLRNTGGAIHDGPAELPNRGRYALVSDPQGAELIFLKASGGDPENMHEQHGNWLWNELWTRDIEQAKRFYTELAGYDTKQVIDADGEPYLLLTSNGKNRAGMVMLPWQEITPHWLPYISVQNITTTIAKTRTLGGRIILAPSPDFDNGSMALIADPDGGVVAIQERKTAAAGENRL